MSRLKPPLVIDPSALMALLLQEREAEAILTAAFEASAVLLSSGSRLELTLVAESRRHGVSDAEINDLLSTLAVEVVSFDQQQLHWALVGWRRFGKGRHPAALNYGDCFSYGLAKALEAPLLFKGSDFAATDVISALGRAADLAAD